MDGTLNLVRKWARFLQPAMSECELVVQVSTKVYRVAQANDFAKKISIPQPIDDMLATSNIRPAKREIPCRDNSRTAEMHWKVYGARTAILQKLNNILYRQPNPLYVKRQYLNSTSSSRKCYARWGICQFS